MSTTKRDAALQGLDRLIESGRRNGGRYKDWAFGYARALAQVGIIEFSEIQDILKERGAW